MQKTQQETPKNNCIFLSTSLKLNVGNQISDSESKTVHYYSNRNILFDKTKAY
jgi:hypothetical protein